MEVEKKVSEYIKKNENFMMTYGDGVTNQNLEELKNFHIKNAEIKNLTNAELANIKLINT